MLLKRSLICLFLTTSAHAGLAGPLGDKAFQKRKVHMTGVTGNTVELTVAL
ncbi:MULTISPECIES: hypothetical protein [Corallococcus]|uniref:hypothetical protein n=1 Tax=Corallococcus TaxID=83461 RepID=UPI00131555BC|nr:MULTISPECIES: hypothetical protein [Corallococcus]